MTTFAKFAGLHPSHNYVGSVPAGAMAVASNVVISSLDIVEPRRGQYSLSYTMGGAPNAVWNYGTTLLAQYGTSITRDTGAAFSDYTGTFTPVDDALCRMRGLEAAQNFYVNTATGMKVLDSAAGAFSDAGVPQCLNVGTLGFNATASGFMARDRAVGYRAVIAQQDANGQWREGAPSQRTVVTTADIECAIGNLNRAANVVTVQLSADDERLKFIEVGSVLTLSPGEANFAAGVKTVASIDPLLWRFTYAEAGVNATSTAVQSFQMLQRSNKISVTLPPGLSSSDVVRLYRTEIAATATTDPGDECYQIAELAVPSAFAVAPGDANNVAATITVTKTAHGLSPGQCISIVSTGADTVDYSIGAIEVLTVPSANTFTFHDANNVGAAGPNVNAITITPISVVYEDITPDTLLSDPLYTNPNTGDGIEASNYQPPRSVDMVFGGERVWWLNTTDQHSFSLQLLGVGAAGSILIVRVDGVDHVIAPSSTPGNYPNSHNGISSAALIRNRSPSVNIEKTALEIVRAINQGVTAAGARLPFYAVYMSATDDVPGKIEIIEYGVGGSPFYISAFYPELFSPTLPEVGVLEGSEILGSDNSRDPAGVMWSPLSTPESHPLANALRIGAKGDPIYRGVWLRDTLFVFKKQGGVHVIPNQLPFRPRELDPTCRLLAPDAVATLNNQIFALTDQGLVTVTEGGVDIIGWPLDYDFRRLINTARSALTRVPFAVAYESERQLWLWLPESGSDTAASIAYIYNHATRTFTSADVERRCGTVMPGTDILWMGSATSNTLVRERKGFNELDYSDEDYTVTLSAVSGTTLTLSSTANVAEGDMLSDADGHSAYVESVAGNDVVTSNTQNWTVPSSVTIHSAFECELASVPLAAGEPGMGKFIPDGVYTFKTPSFIYGKATISTDEEPATAEYTFSTLNGYGSGGYGQLPYGNRADHLNRTVSLGGNGSLATIGFKIRQARAKWRLLAISPRLGAQSERGR
jgi:hypothetical protein